MEQVQNHLATWRQSSSPLNVPMGKSEHKMQTLLDLVLDLRVDNTRLQEENAYLRQLVQELEDQGQRLDGMVTGATSPASSSTPFVEESFDWEALYFDTRPTMPKKREHQEPVHSNGHGKNGTNGQHGQNAHHFAPPPSPPSPPKEEPRPTPPTAVEAMTLEQLMSDMLSSEPELEPEPAIAISDAHEQAEESDLLADFFHFEAPDEPAEAMPETPAKRDTKPTLMTQPPFDAILRDPISGRRLAEVLLEGSLISSRDVAGNQRRVWGFRLLRGDVKAEWRRGKHLYLCLKNGTAVRVRVAGLPADESQNGYVELV